MILQELEKLYGRLAADPAYGIAEPGYSQQKISFVVLLRPDGTLHAIEDARIAEGKKKLAQPRTVPGQAKPSGQGLNPCFLWDNSAYMLGYKAEDEKPERTAKAFEAFRQKHLDLAKDIGSPEFAAVAKFLSGWNPAGMPADIKAVLDDAAATGFGVFKVHGFEGYVHEAQDVRAWWNKQQSGDETEAPSEAGMCLITGATAPAALLHEPAIKGVTGGQSSGTKLVSYNCASFTSYAKEQGENAPVSDAAAFRYCNALNALLTGSRHRLRLGDMTVVFWTDAPSAIEDLFADIFDEKSAKDAPAQDNTRLQKLSAFWKLVQDGAGSPENWKAFGDAPGTRFYMLGLSPNAARLSVRFWLTGTLGDFATRLKEHADALAMVRSFDSDREHPPLWLLLAQTARDSDGIPPLLGGALLRAVLTGGPYPTSMAQLVINRIRADHKIDHLRAAFLKAYLTRLPNTSIPRPLPMSLDTTRSEPAYRLGRLFAALEKTQADAQPGINATIRDRFYGAASATPSAVFPRILRTYQHHLAKLQGGLRVNREKLVQEILGELRDFPVHLNLAEQGLFAIGYYHQTKDFFTKKEPTESAA